jgi:hypothetical protein
VSFIVVFLYCVCALFVFICVTCLLYCCTTATGLKPNCSLTNIYIYISKLLSLVYFSTLKMEECLSFKTYFSTGLYDTTHRNMAVVNSEPCTLWRARSIVVEVDYTKVFIIKNTTAVTWTVSNVWVEVSFSGKSHFKCWYGNSRSWLKFFHGLPHSLQLNVGINFNCSHDLITSHGRCEMRRTTLAHVLNFLSVWIWVIASRSGRSIPIRNGRYCCSKNDLRMPRGE